MRKLFVMLIFIYSTTFGQNINFEIHSTVSAHFMVMDPQGRKTGFDPRIMGHKLDSIDSLQLREIPNSSYGYGGLGSLNFDEKDLGNIEFMCGGPLQSFVGRYKIELIGEEEDSFRIGFSVSVKIGNTSQFSSKFVEGTIEADSSIIYFIDITETPDGKYSISKVVSTRSLLQDIRAMQKIHWISDSLKTYTWIKSIDSAEVLEANSKRCQERDVFESLYRNINADSIILNPKGRISLTSDIQQLISNCPICPFVSKLSPNYIFTSNGSFNLIVSGKNFVNGSNVIWKGTVKETTFFADSILQTNIHASDLAVVDSAIVTVKNPDGGESNGICFYIKQSPVVKGYYVKLISSIGAKLTIGSLQYYEGSWKDATSNQDGTFSINSTAKSLSLRMTYEYGTQTKSNVSISNDTTVFQTVNAQVQLQNSSGNLMDTGSVQYYAGAWRNFGVTINGVASKELLPGSYSFRMSYASASKDKQQDLSTNSTVVFQTVKASVQLQNSQSALIDQGIVQYYSGAWRDFGTTTNGTATKELLPNSYSFRMSYAYASKDKQQDISSNATVVFQTVNAAVQLKNSQGNLVDQGTVQYYSGAWRNFGTTTNGTISKELLPNSYSFRMTNEFISLDKTQDISTNNTVSFATVLCTIRVKNAQSQPVNNAQASYYSGAWRVIGPTVNGDVTKELLPVSLSFRINSGTTQQDKTQNISTNNIVEFSVP
jgi:hypothetical protein